MIQIVVSLWIEDVSDSCQLIGKGDRGVNLWVKNDSNIFINLCVKDDSNMLADK